MIGVLKTFKKELEEERVLVHVGYDLQILKTFPDQYFDWVYIDSSHAYKHTRDELSIVAGKVKDEGVIGGDDWRPEPGHKHHGVYKAVNEFVASGKYRVIYSDRDNLQWAIRKC